MKKQSKDILVVGFALFAMFFGAGNLIFPPLLGLQSGNRFIIAIVGFLIAGVGLPLLGVIATSKAGGRIEDLADKVSPKFSTVLGIIIILCIGPLFAIPRTAATTFEIGVLPLLPGSPAWISSLIFFAITFFFVINPSNVVDNIGKYLTPLLLAVLSILIVKAFVTPIGTPVLREAGSWFTNGFQEGYQTMDALASVIFTTIVIAGVTKRGYKDTPSIIKVTALSGVLAAILLAFVYGGLAYIGATASANFPLDINRSELIIAIVQQLLGGTGTLILGLAISLACLSTAIGLVSATAEFFENLTKGRLPYRVGAIITCVVSFMLSILGVEAIIQYAGPILSIVYPPVIVLIALNLFGGKIKSKTVYRAAVTGALVVSLVEVLNVPYLVDAFQHLPLFSQGFGWLTGALLVTMLVMMLKRVRADASY